MVIAATFLIIAGAAGPMLQAASDELPRSEPVLIQANAAARILGGSRIGFDQREVKGAAKPRIHRDGQGTVWFEFS